MSATRSMRQYVFAAVLLLALGGAANGEEGMNPHHMVGADGALDDSVCSLCHEDDFTLSRSKTETCTLCHSDAPHAGAAQHLRADTAAVKRLAVDREGIDIPLTDEDTLYCGSCHLYHDPAVADEQWLDHGWVPSATEGLGKAVRDELAAWFAADDARRDPATAAATVKWMEGGTRMLRLPAENGTLCKRCHGAGGLER